jgi:hypothetical protein
MLFVLPVSIGASFLFRIAAKRVKSKLSGVLNQGGNIVLLRKVDDFVPVKKIFHLY